MDGIIIINKPKECTSHDVVAKIKKICKEKVGHTGTLDPMATGVLPLLIGEGTKLSEYITNHDKKYIATIKLGIKTDTLDSEGKIIEKQEVDLKEISTENVNKVLKTFLGKQKQTPPMYSAIKIKGKKLYEYAREGKEVEVPEREIEIYEIELLKIENDELSFKVHCSKGTYIRSLCEDIAIKLGTIGYMKELERVKVGEYEINQAIDLKEIEKNEQSIKKNRNIENEQKPESNANIEFLKKHIITIQEFFSKYSTICLEENKLKLFLNGVNLSTNKPDGTYQIKIKNGKWLGVGVVKDKLLKRKIICKNNISMVK